MEARGVLPATAERGRGGSCDHGRGYPPPGLPSGFSGNVSEESGTFSEIFRSEADVFSKSSARDPFFFLNPQLLIRSFCGIFNSRTELFSKCPTGSYRIVQILGIMIMGADAPIPPRARSAAAPDGAPPRRSRERSPT